MKKSVLCWPIMEVSIHKVSFLLAMYGTENSHEVKLQISHSPKIIWFQLQQTCVGLHHRLNASSPQTDLTAADFSCGAASRIKCFSPHCQEPFMNCKQGLLQLQQLRLLWSFMYGRNWCTDGTMSTLQEDNLQNICDTEKSIANECPIHY
jgi:hypothetical protein